MDCCRCGYRHESLIRSTLGYATTAQCVGQTFRLGSFERSDKKPSPGDRVLDHGCPDDASIDEKGHRSTDVLLSERLNARSCLGAHAQIEHILPFGQRRACAGDIEAGEQGCPGQKDPLPVGQRNGSIRITRHVRDNAHLYRRTCCTLRIRSAAGNQEQDRQIDTSLHLSAFAARRVAAPSQRRIRGRPCIELSPLRFLRLGFRKEGCRIEKQLAQEFGIVE
jgi:hypothetical protein